MLKYILTCVLLFSIRLLAYGNDIEVSKMLAKRIAPAFADRIIFSMIPGTPGKDEFDLSWNYNKLVIRGNNANSMATGLNYYLKYFCHTSVSWYKDDRIFLPASMPVINTPIHHTARCNSRFMLNYCTFGYTMPWWTWKEWERFIDWMALNGINMPLAITGEEYVWYEVWKKMGLNDLEIRNFFTGPAFLPWHRMANVDHWEGPLPWSWLNGQVELQKKILKRERELNMKPVLPAFAGHVPEILRTKYPTAKITSLGKWGEFDKEYESFFLDPFDSLFNMIQKDFLEEQTKLFGTDHIYGTDPFNEVTPPSWEPAYLANVAKIIYSSMKTVDSNAQWLQMTWIFYNNRKNWTDERIKAYLEAVPQDKLILLDYFCDNTEVWKATKSFYGQPYLWCYLGNFGGNTMMSGNLKEVESRMENTFKNGGKNMWGIGSTLEGFGINPIAYEYVFEKAWSDGAVDVDQWVSDWATRRYGHPDKNVIEAWNILLNTTYSEAAGLGRATLTNSRPVLKNFQSWTTNPIIKYENRELLKAWDLLNQAKEKTTDVYEFDLVNTGRQVLGNYFKNVRDEFTDAYEKKDTTLLIKKGGEMISLMNDMDTLLGSNKNSLVGKWIADAMAMGVNTAEKKYYEQDAKKIITVWGQEGRQLVDYGNRSWAGLMKSYYGERWKMFVGEIITHVKNDKPFDEKEFSASVKDFEENWAEKNESFASSPHGNTLAISKGLYKKYSEKIAGIKK
ncbi:MAG TPA: alpha-N-acetylglucosaminidase [Chitinophagaceae bacterium]|nr:alpha-N-acetylglucosaminidase [Chitinophagaceae bacterium]